MHSIPFALSLHISSDVHSIGADAGFAALIGLALLVLLYFAQMRETATLRERLDDAYGRIGNLEARIGQLQALRSQQAAPRPGVVPAPASVTARPMGSAIASVRRVPASGPAPAAATDGLLPAAPAGVGAPALASATKGISDPVRGVPAAAPSGGQDTMMIGPGGLPANGGSNGAGTGLPPLAPGVPAPAASRATADAGTDPVVTGAPPRVQIRPEAPAGTVPRRASLPPRYAIDPPKERDLGRRLLLGLGGLVAIAAIVVVLLALTSKGSPSTPVASTTTHKQTKTTPAVVAFHPSSVVVSVLNGTDVGGLAADAAKQLSAKGYKVPSAEITNFAVQTQQVTAVSYVKGTPSGRSDADHVAAALGVSKSNVGVATQTDLQSCATPQSQATSTTSCDADVIVTLGADKAGLASSSSSS